MRNSYEVDRATGDGTVPLLSAQRFKNGVSLNAAYNDPQDPHYFVVNPAREEQDADADHVGMAKNMEVLSKILEILSTPTSGAGSSGFAHARGRIKLRKSAAREFVENLGSNSMPRQNFNGGATGRPLSSQTTGESTLRPDTYQPTQHDPSYYIDLVGIKQLTVTDAFGNSNTPVGDIFMQAVPGVDIE